MRRILWPLITISAFGISNALFAVPVSLMAPHPIIGRTQKKPVTQQATVAQQAEAPPTTTTRIKTETLEEKVNRLEKQLAAITQNRDNPQGSPEWLKIFKLGGLLDIDAYDETKPGFGVTQTRADKISLATAKLNVDANINSWVSGRIGLFFSDTDTRYYLYKNASTNGIQMDDAYAQISNFNVTPFYFRAGQVYLPFGRYHRYPITRTLTQDLTETREVAGEIGFVDKSGFYGAGYAFNGLKRYSYTNRDSINNYGANLGYKNTFHPLVFDLGIGYLNNMVDVGQISYNLANSSYTRRVGAFNVYGSAAAGPFSFDAAYVTALTNFSPVDFQWQLREYVTRGAKPSAANFNVGYMFNLFKRHSKIEVSYQLSQEAHNVNGAPNAMALPKDRVSVGIGSEILKNTILAAEYRRDRDYPTANGGTNAFDNVITLRLTLLLM